MIRYGTDKHTLYSRHTTWPWETVALPQDEPTSSSSAFFAGSPKRPLPWASPRPPSAGSPRSWRRSGAASLRIIEGFSDQIKRWLAVGDVEVGIYSMYREADEHALPTLFASNLVLAGAAAAKLPPEIEFSALSDIPLVLPSILDGLRTTVESVARRMRFSLDVVVDADSIHAQKLIAKHCGCCMIEVLNIITEEIAKGEFCTSMIRNPQIQRPIILVTTHQHPLSRAVTAAQLRETLNLKDC